MFTWSRQNCADPVNNCEPDEYACLVLDMRRAGLIVDGSFSGGALVDWLVNTKHIDAALAMHMGQQLITRDYTHTAVAHKSTEFSRTGKYRLVEVQVVHCISKNEFYFRTTRRRH